MEKLILHFLTRLGFGRGRMFVSCNVLADNLNQVLGNEYSVKAENEDANARTFVLRITDNLEGWDTCLLCSYRISENGYRIITSIVFVSRKKLLKQEQGTITIDQARNMLMSYVNDKDLGDNFHEFLQNYCNSAIEDIEAKYTIIDADGDICTDEDEEMWYDECRDEFIEATFNKIQTGQF